MVGFEHMEWKSRCADRFISMYGYKATHKYYEDGREHTYHYVPGKNETMSMMTKITTAVTSCALSQSKTFG